MQLGYDVRYLRWLAGNLAGSTPVGVPGLDHLLWGLLIQQAEPVVGVLAAVGVDIPGLMAAAKERASSREFESCDEYWPAYRAAFSQVGPREAGALGSDRLHCEHLLLAITAEPGPFAGMLGKYGVDLERLRSAVRARMSGVAQTNDHTWRDRLVREGWFRAMTTSGGWEMQFPEKRHPVESYPVHSYRICGLAGELREAGEFKLLGHLYEALGTTNELFIVSDGPPFLWLHAQQLAISAHFYRGAGEQARAELVARRVVDILHHVLADLPLDKEWGLPLQEPYLTELMADAEVCFDQRRAEARYVEALAAFERLDSREPSAQMGEGAEMFGWGGFHLEQAEYFLPGDPRDLFYHAEPRITRKRRCWICQ